MPSIAKQKLFDKSVLPSGTLGQKLDFEDNNNLLHLSLMHDKDSSIMLLFPVSIILPLLLSSLCVGTKSLLLVVKPTIIITGKEPVISYKTNSESSVDGVRENFSFRPSG